MNTPLIPLYRYQKRWIQDLSRFKAGLFCRQGGKTFTGCLEIVDNCFSALVKAKRKRWVILSRGERQAKEAMEEAVKPHAKSYQLAFDSLEYDWHGGEGAVYRASEILLPHGSRITALPANPDTARGYSANVLLDEFAFHRDSRKIWTAVFPIISKDDLLLRVLSSANGKDNVFHDIIETKDGIWSRHRVDIYQAVADGLPRDIAALKAAINDDDAWAQEYELQWLDEASAWLPYDLISACEHEAAGIAEEYAGGPCFIGNDIARRQDLWVAIVWELVGDVLWAREIVVRQRISFAEQDAILDDVMDRYDVRRIAMDQTGMGEKPVEDAKRRYGASRVEGVLMTQSRKYELAIAAKEAFEDRRVRIPMGDRALRTDLHSIKKVTSPTGAPRLLADREGGSHADRAWAAFLGIAAACGPKMEYNYEGIPNPRGGDASTWPGLQFGRGAW